MATPYIEYTDPDGNKSKLEIPIDVKGPILVKFYKDHMEKHHNWTHDE